MLPDYLMNLHEGIPNGEEIWSLCPAYQTSLQESAGIATQSQTNAIQLFIQAFHMATADNQQLSQRPAFMPHLWNRNGTLAPMAS